MSKSRSYRVLLKNTRCLPVLGLRLSEHIVGPQLPNTGPCKVQHQSFCHTKVLGAAEPRCSSQHPSWQAPGCTAWGSAACTC